MGIINTINVNGDSCDQFHNIVLSPGFAFGYGNFNLQANSPCIDAGDPARPLDPDSTLADMGALYLDQVPPSLSLDLTPHSLPIFIPPGGGSFVFDAVIENLSSSPVTFDTWIMVTLPGGTNYGPILLRQGLTLPGSANLTRVLTQVVPASAPGGYYTYRGYAGTYPGEVVAADQFVFAKLGDSPEGPIGDWPILGWSVEQIESLQPQEPVLLDAWPNPFNPSTDIRFQITDSRYVSLKVYDIAGRLVATLINDSHSDGKMQVTFNAGGLPAGIYFARLQTGNLIQVRKLVLIK